MKGEAWGKDETCKTELNKIEKSTKDEARKYIAKYHNNSAKDINLKKLREKGFKMDGVNLKNDDEEDDYSRKGGAGLPGLVVSSDQSSSSPTSGSEEPMEGGRPSNHRSGNRSPK